MHALHFTDARIDPQELSRHAAERHAVLTALADRRTRDHRASRPDRSVTAVPAPLAIDSWFRRKRWS